MTATVARDELVFGESEKRPRRWVSPALDWPMPTDRFTSWLWALAVTLFAGVLRFVGLSHPKGRIFDETYYAVDAHSLLLHAVEKDKNGGPGFVAHPPLGKWMIAVGEQLFGYNSLGWRFSAAVVGTLMVLVLVRVVRRMFRSTLLGCIAGLLLSMDGLHFVQSRVALLDIFLAAWILFGFAFLVMDRDQFRRRLANLIAEGRDLSSGVPRIGFRWYRMAGAACLGAACAVKWSGVWYVFGFLALSWAWDIGARRSAGVDHPYRDGLLGEWPGVFGGVLLALVVYVAAWSGWFFTGNGWDRHWVQDTHRAVGFGPIDAFRNLWHYHAEVWRYHTHLHAWHPYRSRPWTWLILGRPVSYHYISPKHCGAPTCSQEVLALGTPLLWWAFIPALVFCVWRLLSRRDWRAQAALVGFAAGFVPWLPFPTRTMFYFYALPFLPFCVIAVTYCLGVILGPRDTYPERRATGAILVAGYVAAVALTFAYFYPLYAAKTIPYDDWHARIWFQTWI
ncbi:MAG: dolichyl-phosphate-mannose--protein mannosyltransferase [Mycobacteriales bacterium]